MTDPVRTVSVEQLLAHRAWVRALARRLVASEAEADDVEQDTWLAALRSPPRAGRVRGWLAQVVRNAARQRARSAGRRAHWEGRVDAPAPADPAAEVVARAEAHQRIVRAVMALDEPYRATVLLRFFDDLPPREVAARLGVPVETVRTRTRRALTQLRQRLDGEHGGDRRAWCLALLPLVERPETVATAGAMGVLAMGATTKWLAGGAVVLALAGWAWQRADAPPPPGPEDAPAAETAVADPERPDRTRVRRGTAAPTAPAATASAPASDAPRSLRVVVHDEHGAGIAGAATHLISGEEILGRGVTGRDGSVSIEAPDGALRVVVTPPFRPLLIGRVGASQDELVLTATAGFELEGILRVDGGAPPPRTWIRLELPAPHTEYGVLPAAIWKELGLSVGTARVTGTVGPEGRFHFRGLPAAPRTTVVLHPAYVEAESGAARLERPLPARALVIEAVTLPVVSGRVVRPDGAVAGGAHLWLHSEGPKGRVNMGFRTGADGRFEMRLADVACTSATLKIVGADGLGWRDVVLDPPPRTAHDLGDVVLTETRSAAFHVSSAGAPIAGAVVVRRGTATAKPTDEDGVAHVPLDPREVDVEVGALGFQPATVTVPAGDPGPYLVDLQPDTLVRVAVARTRTEDPRTGLFVIAAVDEGSASREITSADVAAGATDWLSGARREATRVLEPNEEDRVVVVGLRAGVEVDLRLVDVTGVVHAETRIVAEPGRPLDVTLAERGGGRLLRGVVTDEGGEPIDGAYVSVAVQVPGAPATDLPRSFGVSLNVRTDGQGRYVLGPVHADHASLRVVAAGRATRVVSRVDGAGEDVALAPAQRVTVTVVDAAGIAVDDAAVSFRDPELGKYPEPPRPRLARRTEDGVYTLRDVPPREVEIAVRHGGSTHRFRHDGRESAVRLTVPSAGDGD